MTEDELRLTNILRDADCDFPYSIAAALIRAGVVIREKAEWVYDPNGNDWGIGAWVCSKCGVKNDNLGCDDKFPPRIHSGSSFCSHCGRDMRDGN